MKRIGLSDHFTYKKLLRFVFPTIVMIVVGAALSVIGFVFMRKIAQLLGATELVLKDCVVYGRILILGVVPFMLQNAFQSFLVVAEKPKFGLIVSVAAGAVNIVLDFLFVYVFCWGVAGAALATLLSQITGSVVPLVYFVRKTSRPLRLVKAVFVLPLIFEINGVWFAITAAELLTLVVTVVFFVRYRKVYHYA